MSYQRVTRNENPADRVGLIERVSPTLHPEQDRLDQISDRLRPVGSRTGGGGDLVSTLRKIYDDTGLETTVISTNTTAQHCRR
jgi:hypothetical protein